VLLTIQKKRYHFFDICGINGHSIYDPNITYQSGSYEPIQEYIKLYPNDYS